jgi:ABC-type sugar transport system ATPase subunit
VPILELRGIGKRFGGVRALHDVSFTIEAGECHALMGENGAGKSTLGRVLAGILRSDAGELRVDGRPVAFRSPADAQAAGIGMVHQELACCPDLSVAENLALGRWPRRGPGGSGRGPLVDRRAMERRARELLAGIGAELDVRRTMRELSTAQEQRVQVAAAVGSGARVIVFDEPTSALTGADAERLYTLIGALRARGVTVIYVSHRIPEVFRLADRITVLRDGARVATLPRDETSPRDLVRRMIGRELSGYHAGPPPGPPGEVLLEVEGLASRGRIEGVGFRVRAREIVGLAGLVGAGRSEVLRALFGLDPHARGRVTVTGRPLRLGSTRAALTAGLALVPEDRKRQGLVLPLGARANWALAQLPALRRRARPARALGLLDGGAERRRAAASLASVDVRAASLDAPVAALSGGNQQKVVLARWLATGARVLLVDEPTRGVDVGAKAAIHHLLAGRAADGAAILLVSSELDELLALSSRVLVLREGRLVAELPRGASEEAVMTAMAGVPAA